MDTEGKSQNSVEWEENSAVSGLFEFNLFVCWISTDMFCWLASLSAQFILELIWTVELELVVFGMLWSSQGSELCSLLAPSDSSVTWGFLLNLGTLQFLSTWLYRLATDLSRSARFWMFFRIPLSSFLCPVSVCDGSGGGGCFRSETGRSEDAGGKEAGTNWTTGRDWSVAGEGGGGRGGGGGGASCFLTGGRGGGGGGGGEEGVSGGSWR